MNGEERRELRIEIREENKRIKEIGENKKKIRKRKRKKEN